MAYKDLISCQLSKRLQSVGQEPRAPDTVKGCVRSLLFPVRGILVSDAKELRAKNKMMHFSQACYISLEMEFEVLCGQI